jgi:hypothetical protein
MPHTVELQADAQALIGAGMHASPFLGGVNAYQVLESFGECLLLMSSPGDTAQ